MDQRQTKIVEGAGLEESRLNQDFIDFLRRWGSPILFALCIAAAAYAALTWWQRTQAEALDVAYTELTAAQESGSPDGLIRVAREHEGQGAVAEIATLLAADQFRLSATRGVVPGGDPAVETDLLDEAAQAANFERALELYREALRHAGADRSREIFAMNAQFGIAACTLSLGRFDEGETALRAAAEIARRLDLPDMAEKAEETLAGLDELRNPPTLYTEDQVAAAARPAPPTSDLFSPNLDLSLPIGPAAPAPTEPEPAEPTDGEQPGDEQAQPAPSEPGAP